MDACKIVDGIGKQSPKEETTKTKEKKLIPQKRRTLFKKLCEVKKQFTSESSISKISDILFQIKTLEKELQENYSSEKWSDEVTAIENIKKNHKTFIHMPNLIRIPNPRSVHSLTHLLKQ